MLAEREGGTLGAFRTDIAAVLTYVRNSWGNAAPAIESSQVERARGPRGRHANASSVLTGKTLMRTRVAALLLMLSACWEATTAAESSDKLLIQGGYP